MKHKQILTFGPKKNMILISSAKSNNFGDEDTYVNHDYILLYSNF